MNSFDVFRGPRGRVAAGLVVAEFTAATQSLVVTTVMPKIAADLHGIALYGLAYASLFGASLISMPFAGPLADRYGVFRVLAIAYALMLLGLAGSMTAPTMPLFVLARGVEGFAGGLDYVVSVAAIAKLFPEEQRPRMFAWISAMWVVPGLIGPGIGALIAATLGWRFVFALFVPLVLISAFLVLPALRAMKGVAREGDPLGAIRVLLLPETLLLRTTRSITIASFAFLQAAFFGADAYVTLLLTAIRGFSLGLAGVCITVAVVGWTVASSLQPYLTKRLGPRGLVACGGFAGAVGLGTLIAVVLGAPAWLAFAACALNGFGIGLSFATLTMAALAQWPEGSEGTASSATLVAGTVGSTIGVSLCGLPITFVHAHGDPLATGLVWTFSIALALVLALLALTRRLPDAANA